MARKILNNKLYIQTGADQLHWILGRNPVNKVFVIGFFENGVKRPHYKAVKVYCPDPNRILTGLMVKKPTICSRFILQAGEHPPLLSYTDYENATMCNEPDMEPQSLFVFTAGYFTFSGE